MHRSPGFAGTLAALGFGLALSVPGCGDGESIVTHRSGEASAAESACEATEKRCSRYGDARPFRPSEHSAVHVSTTGEMVIFGGSKALPTSSCGPGPTDYTDETWIYSEACDLWSQVTGSGPSARARHSAAYGAGRMWVFGGRFREQGASSGSYMLFEELWAFDPAKRSWELRATEGETPAARTNSSMAWDSKRERIWMFSGNASTAGFSYTFLDDLWSYEPAQNRWRSHQGGGEAPSPRMWHDMLYDEARDQLVVYGGMDAEGAPASYLSDIYTMNLETLEWEQLHAGGASAPDPRFWGSLVYRPEREDYLAFGGHDQTELGNRNDTHRFDPVERQWTRLHAGDSFQTPANGVCDFPPDFASVDSSQPERRHAGSMIWSTACNRALLFGGKSDCGIIDDMWAFSDGDWSLVQQATEGRVCLRWREDTSRCTSLCQ